MSEHVFFGFWLLLFGTILIVFGMKYISAAYQARSRIADDEAYRKLAADAVTAQAGNAATLSAIQSELAELKTRTASVEKILKDVE
jgi:Tfp pilus assembly protein PilO